jgi:hypothetical protein
MVVIHCQVLDQPTQICPIQQGDEKALYSMALVGIETYVLVEVILRYFAVVLGRLRHTAHIPLLEMAEDTNVEFGWKFWKRHGVVGWFSGLVCRSPKPEAECEADEQLCSLERDPVGKVEFTVLVYSVKI